MRRRHRQGQQDGSSQGETTSQSGLLEQQHQRGQPETKQRDELVRLREIGTRRVSRSARRQRTGAGYRARRRSAAAVPPGRSEGRRRAPLSQTSCSSHRCPSRPAAPTRQWRRQCRRRETGHPTITREYDLAEGDLQQGNQRESEQKQRWRRQGKPFCAASPSQACQPECGHRECSQHVALRRAPGRDVQRHEPGRHEQQRTGEDQRIHSVVTQSREWQRAAPRPPFRLNN